MLINWFTVGSQTLNFLILVWLMKHFLYKPVLNAIDVREKKVAAEIADANNKKNEAQKESDEFNKKNEDFDRERAALLSKAVEEAKVERVRLMADAHKAADDLRVKRLEALKNEQKNLNSEISRRAQNQIFAIAKKTLTDLANVSLEERMVDIFIHRMGDLKINEGKALKVAVDSTPDPLIIRSACELPPAQKTALESAIKNVFGVTHPLEFKTDPSLVSGIECTVNGRKIAWSISDYLTSLKESLNEVLKTPAQPSEKTT
jgi:F-type H+-transporting ATPase subunit b